MEKGEKFLPIGSVVLLNGGTKKVMITGYCVGSAKNRERLWDYSGCLFPEGIISSNQTALFDHNQIADVFFKGCVDEEQEAFISKLKDFISKPDKVVLMNDYQMSHKPATPSTTSHIEEKVQNDTPKMPNEVDIPQTSVPHVDVPIFDDKPHIDIPPKQ